MSITVRSITPDEAGAFRRALRAGFSQADTVEDDEWAKATLDPVDRVLAAFDDSSIVATFQSYQTELTLPGGAGVAAGAVTAVTCRATHRRQGLLTRMITADLVGSRDRGEAADVLIAAEYPIYGRYGYGPAAPSMGWELDANAAQFTNGGAGSVEFVDNATFRDAAPAIFERVRAARPGMISLRQIDWDVRADLRRRPEDKPWEGFRLLCRDDAGEPQGWANYTAKLDAPDGRARGKVDVADLCAATPAAEARLWRFLAELDLVATVVAGDRPIDDLLPWLLVDARVAKRIDALDFLWLRPLDVPALLEARAYLTAGRVVLEVVDDCDLAAGRFVLDATPDGASCRSTTEPAGVTMSARTLGAAVLGGVRLATLHHAGWLDEHAAGAVAAADALLAWNVAPWCNTWF